MKAADKAQLKGYLQLWNQGKILVGCDITAMYIEVLKASSILSLTLQEDEADIVQGLQHILKSANALQTLGKQHPKNWPTVKVVVRRVSKDGDQKVYQGAVLKNLTDDMLAQCSCQTLADLQKLDGKMRKRLEWTDVKFLRSTLVHLDTCNWTAPIARHNQSGSDVEEEEGADDMAKIRAAVEHIVTIFRDAPEVREHACHHWTMSSILQKVLG